MPEAILGGCLCGAVKYKLEGELFDARSCHCSTCRKAFSAQASAYALVDPAAFSWLCGEHLLTHYESGNATGLQFCSRCGSTLSGTYQGEIHGLTLGCVDGDPGVTLGRHIFVGSKATWEELPSGVPQYDTWPTDGARLAHLSWSEAEQQLKRGSLAVLPIGCASKEHGRHLPLATDYIQAEWLADRVAEQRRCLVWPSLSYGYYPAFVDYPGSTSLSRRTFVASVVEILEGIARAGAKRIAVLNTGISTIEPLREALRDSRLPLPLELVNVYSGSRLAKVRAEVEQQPWGGHADEIETALMLAIAPQWVKMQHAEAAPEQIKSGRFNRLDPQGPNYSPSGVNGDPTLATRAKGERLLAALLEDTLDALDTFIA